MSPDVSPPRRDWIALFVLCLGMLMIVLDGTIVNTALPVLKESLDFSDGNLTWVLNAYLIPFGGLLMLFLVFRPRGLLDEVTVHRLGQRLRHLRAGPRA